jgi:uracil-DNA glycosylase
MTTTDLNVDLEEIKVRLIAKLGPSGWATKLRGFVQSSDFSKTLETLYSLRKDGKRFTPPLKYVFRGLEECPLDELKVIIIGQDPYPYLNVADGIAFSCGLTGKPQPSLQKIFEEIEKTVYQGFPTHQDPDLTRWSKQGVLLINTALTCQVDKVGSHYDIWQPFLNYLIDMLSLTSSGLIFCLLGAKAQEFEGLITPSHYVLKASHPASAAYNKGTWDSGDMFNQINEILLKNNGPQYTINW